jgi:hypothetical protein
MAVPVSYYIVIGIYNSPQGLAVIFSHRQVYVKREGRTLFLLPKVKVEFRHLFSLQKRFVEGFKLAFLREIIYSSCQKIFLKCCLPIFPD